METLEIIDMLKKIPKENIYHNELMKNHTSFKIGGPAELFIKIDSIDQMQQVLEITKKYNIQLTIVGNGSNLLVKDNGIKGIVAKIELKNIEINNKKDEVEIIVDSGVLTGYLSQKLLKEEITGFEELSGIPGTIGGAIYMNAGAHGKEIKDIVKEITVMDYNGNIEVIDNKDADFGYRSSIFQKKKYIILNAKLYLKKGNKEKIKEKMNEYAKYRKEKQPIEYPSAGSTFKRGDDFITAKLIDDVGLKGYKIGGAQVSEKHAGFIINIDNAKASDVINLTEYVKEKVYEQFGKKIELEIKVIGE